MLPEDPMSGGPGRRVARCFAFLDLSGFTAYTAEHGDGAAVAVLAHLRATVRTLAARHGVRVTKWLGDGVMLSSASTDRLVECCVRVRHEVRGTGVLALRGGICHGPVIMFEGDDYVGACVNIAARLCAAAGPGVLLADAVAMRQVPEADVVERGDLTLRGTPEPVEIVEVIAFPADWQGAGAHGLSA